MKTVTVTDETLWETADSTIRQEQGVLNVIAENSSQANISATAPLFPLPLSDFEYYMLVDDRPSHPMVFVMVVQLSGCLNRPDFQRAVFEAVQSHPLFDCRVRRLDGRGWCWVPMHSSEITIDWQQTACGGNAVGENAVIDSIVPLRSIDLQTSRGLEVCVEQSDSVSRVVFYLHHACCDGIGGLQFVGEVLARYGQYNVGPGERPPEFVSTRQDVLLKRERFDGCAEDTAKQPRSLRRSLAKAARLIFRRPVPLLPSISGESGSSGSAAVINSALPAPPRAIRTAVLPRSVACSLQRLSTRLKVSVNDLLIREMLVQIFDWNQQSGGMNGNPWLRIAVPVSMRTVEHQLMPAANLVSYAFITRRAQECGDSAALLASIHRQTGDVLFNREGLVFLRCIRILRRIPGALRALLGFKSCFCTAVLANVGEIRRRFAGRFPLQDGKWRAGNVVVEQICGVAPIRPNTRAAVTVNEYGGQFYIHLRTDAAVLSESDSVRFLSEFTQRLATLAAAEPDE